MVEIGCININTKVSLLFSYLVMSREGCLKALSLSITHTYHLTQPFLTSITAFLRNATGQIFMRVQ